MNADTSRGRTPNIVFIMADDMGHECLGVNGCRSYRTPHLDKIASRGVRFTHCYSTPLCTPSRVQVMTGRYGFRNYEGFCFLNPAETTFANSLKDAGYATAITGKWQLGGGADRVAGFGFDEHCLNNMGVDHLAPNTLAGGRYADPLIYRNGSFLPDDEIEGRYGPDICSEFALDFVERNRDRPFLLYYPMILVHSPFQPTPDSPEWADPRRRKERARSYFKDMVEYADKLVGRLVAKLEELDLLDDTLIMFTGDNGTARAITTEMRDGSVVGGKGTMPDAGTHVPLVAALGGTSPDNHDITDLVDFSDVFPTIAEAAGAKLPENVVMDGRSFLPQIKGEKGDPRDWAFCHYDPMVPFADFQANAGRWARGRRFKLYHDGRFYDVPADVLEESALSEEGLSEEAGAARARLASVLASMGEWEERGAKYRGFTKEQSRRFVHFINRR